MIRRTLENTILQVAPKIPVVVITGPRQSGKTTLVRTLFPEYAYNDLEFPDTFELAKNDPRTFLRNLEKGIILDEIQRIPELLSYIQGITDEKRINGKVILTGSQNLQLMQAVTQTLAGRTVNMVLLPFSMRELALFGALPSMETLLFQGFYPRLYDQGISPVQWFPSYIQSYIERDLRQLVQIRDLDKFQLFTRVLAGRIGQLINYQSISAEIGVDAKTIRNWISLLETSYIIFQLKPYHKNFNKRLIKSPKVYFYDTGLACSLLGIRDVQQISLHYLKGALFENMIVSEIQKEYCHTGFPSNLYFWRESSGYEIDCVIENPNGLTLIEIKSSATFHDDFLKNIRLFDKIAPSRTIQKYLVYAGDPEPDYQGTRLVKWSGVGRIIPPGGGA